MAFGINLHRIVRGTIESVHGDEECQIYQACGQKNIKGKVHPIYQSPVDACINFQPLDSQALQHLEAVGDTSTNIQAFLYSNKPYPIAGIKRIPIARGGDYIRRENGEWFKITAVFEDWSQDGWINVGLNQQPDGPDLTYSEGD